MPYNAHNMPGPGDEVTWGPCTNHPMDPRTPPDFVESGRALSDFVDRLQDLNGYLVESFSEAPDGKLQELADAIEKVTCEDGTPYIGNSTSNEELVEAVVGIVTAYCWKDEED